METADKVVTPIAVGMKGSDAALLLESLRVSLNKAVDEIDAAEGAEVTLDAKLDAIALWVTNTFVVLAGLAADLDAGGNKITNADDGVEPSDLATVQQVAAGQPVGNIPVTALNRGSATALQLLRINAAGDGIEGHAPAISYINSAVTLTNNQFAAVDSSGGTPFALTLPANPDATFRINLVDYAQSWGDTNITLARNGENIMGLAEDFVLHITGGPASLAWVDATRGWILI